MLRLVRFSSCFIYLIFCIYSLLLTLSSLFYLSTISNFAISVSFSSLYAFISSSRSAISALAFFSLNWETACLSSSKESLLASSPFSSCSSLTRDYRPPCLVSFCVIYPRSSFSRSWPSNILCLNPTISSSKSAIFLFWCWSKFSSFYTLDSNISILFYCSSLASSTCVNSISFF